MTRMYHPYPTQQAEARRFIKECWGLQGVAYVVIGVRYFSRIRQLGWHKLALDDSLMLLALFVYTAESVMAHLVVAQWHGLANNAMTQEQRATIDPNSEEYRLRVNGSKTHVVGLLLYLTLLWLLKACWSVYYARLTAGIYHMRRWIIGAYILTPLTYIACLCVAFLKCIPFSRQWQIYPDPGNHCEPAISVLQTVFVMIMNTATDFYLLGIPLPIIWKSNLPWSKKLVLLIMFSGGFIEMAFGILRCVSILTTGNTDPSQSGYWSVRESFVSFVLTNMPMIYPLLKRLVDHAVYSLAGWSRQTRSQTKTGTNAANINTNSTSIKSNGFMLTPQGYPYPIDSPMFNPIRSGASRGATDRQGSIPDPLFHIPGSEAFWASTISEENTIGTGGTGPTSSGGDDVCSRQTSHATVASQSEMVSYRSDCDSPTRSRNDCGRPADLMIQTATPAQPSFGMVTSVESSGMSSEQQPHHGLCSGESSSSSSQRTAGSVRGIMVTREVMVREEGVCTPRPITPGLPPTELWGWGDFHLGY